jgi:hypothetical protein
MKKRACSICGRTAFAYRIEADGARTYFCMTHLPDGEAPHEDEAARNKPETPLSRGT